MSNYYRLLQLLTPKILRKSVTIWNVFCENQRTIKKFTYLNLSFLKLILKNGLRNKPKIHFSQYSPKWVYRVRGGISPLVLNLGIRGSNSRHGLNNPGKEPTVSSD